MPVSVGTAGNHASFAFCSGEEFRDPLVRVHGYTEPSLTFPQHAAVILAASTTSACLKSPIGKLSALYFLSDVSGELNRIYASDKRAHFFRTLFGMRWFAGQPIFWSTSEYVFQLTLFIKLRELLPWGGNSTRGFVAGGLTGIAYAVVRHPYDVLSATAEAFSVPKKFTGAGDVLRTALRERPSILLGIYRGVAAAAGTRALQFSAQFGVYNATRHDGVYRHTLVLFFYCHLAVFVGQLLHYPFLSLKQALHMRNQFTRQKPHSYRSYISEVRMRHGITKIYDGFFTGRPVLNAVPAALMMTLYDLWARRYTEFLHPELRKVHGEVDQSLCSVRTSPYARTLPTYEFKRS